MSLELMRIAAYLAGTVFLVAVVSVAREKFIEWRWRRFK